MPSVQYALEFSRRRFRSSTSSCHLLRLAEVGGRALASRSGCTRLSRAPMAGARAECGLTRSGGFCIRQGKFTAPARSPAPPLSGPLHDPPTPRILPFQAAQFKPGFMRLHQQRAGQPPGGRIVGEDPDHPLPVPHFRIHALLHVRAAHAFAVLLRQGHQKPWRHRTPPPGRPRTSARTSRIYCEMLPDGGVPLEGPMREEPGWRPGHRLPVTDTATAEDVAQQMNLAALPCHSLEVLANRLPQAMMGIRNDEHRTPQAHAPSITGPLQSPERLIPGGKTLRITGLEPEHLPVAVLADAAHDQGRP